MFNSAFSPKYKGSNNAFSQNAHHQRYEKTKINSFNNNIYKEIQKLNEKLLKQIKTNMEAYRKNSDNKKSKARAFEICDEKLKEMLQNIKKEYISLDEFYNDERSEIVKDIKEAQEILKSLK